MPTTSEKLQTLRLLRAFWKIRDDAAREAIIKAAEQVREAEPKGPEPTPAP